MTVSGKTIKLSVKELNQHLSCKICDGYFRDAHTIPDCLHTFCKICLFKEFSKRTSRDAKYCPLCNTNLGSNPWSKVIFDRTLQAIVDKIFPQFALEDDEDEKKINENINSVKRELENDQQENSSKKVKYDPSKEDDQLKDTITIRVVPSSAEDIPVSKRLPFLTKPLLKTISTIKISKIQNFIKKRLVGIDTDISPRAIIIMFKDEVLKPADTLQGCFADPTILSCKKPAEWIRDPLILTYKRG